MRRAYKYRLYPTKTQTVLLSEQLETLRRVYNQALSERKDAYELYGAPTSKYDQARQWRARRNADRQANAGPRWLARVCSTSVRDTLYRLDRSFQNFFRRVKTGENPGYPRFQGRERFNSIPFDNYNSGSALVGSDGKPIFGDMSDDAELRGHRVHLFGVGNIKVKLHRPVKGKIKTLTVKREAGKWYVVLSCDLGDVKAQPSSNPAIGIDVGIEHFLTTSDGEHVANPQPLRAALGELRQAQRACSTQAKKDRPRARKKKRFGSNWRKAVRRVSKLHVKVANRRKDHQHKTALDLVRRFGTIAVEDLTVKNMVRNHRLARAIGDAGWSGFLAILTYKAEEAGVGVVRVDPRGTSQTCPRCQKEVRKELSDRRHECPHCGLSVHRDHAAAMNILARAGVPVRAEPAGQNVTQQGERAPRNLSCPDQLPGDHCEWQANGQGTGAGKKTPSRGRERNGQPGKTLWEWRAQDLSGA